MVQYCTTKQAFDYLGISKNYIREFDNALDNFGTGDDSTTRFLTSKRNIIASNYTFYYGATEAAALSTPLTETTHYTINKDLGILTLTGAGVTLVSTNKLYGDYWYTDNVSDSQMSDIIDKQTSYIDKECERTWQTITQELNETHTGRGKFYRQYRIKNMPLKVVQTTLTTTVDDTETGFVLGSTTGLTAGDYLLIDSEIVTIDSVDNGTELTVTRAAKSTTGAAHTAGANVINLLVELSTTPMGSVPTYSYLTVDKDYAYNMTTGVITLLHNDITPEGITASTHPELRVPNRLRLTYSYGESSVDESVEELCILLSSKKMFQAGVLSALSRETNGFQTDSMSDVNDSIKTLIKELKLMLAGGF